MLKTKQTICTGCYCFVLVLMWRLCENHIQKKGVQMHILKIGVAPSLPPLKASPRGLPFSHWGYLSFLRMVPHCVLPPASFVLIEFISAPLGPCCLNLGLWVVLLCRVSCSLGDSLLCLSLLSIGNMAKNHRECSPNSHCGLVRSSGVKP